MCHYCENGVLLCHREREARGDLNQAYRYTNEIAAPLTGLAMTHKRTFHSSWPVLLVTIASAQRMAISRSA